MSRPLCIYHGNCADGFSAAWAVWSYFAGDCDFHAGVYGAPPPDVTARDVIIVDFSYKRDVLVAMAASAASVLVLDHHKTAEADLAGYLRPVRRYEDIAVSRFGLANVFGIFDMQRSGAMITWDFFFPGEMAPKLLEHIQDRDLWLFQLEGTREIQANVFSYPYEFEIWDRLMASDPQVLRAEGAAIERKHHKDVAELVGVTRRFMTIGGLNMPVANMPYTLTSDAGHMMAKATTAGAAACYWDTPGGRVFSLRSLPEGPDVSDIAKRYGGGGHEHAAGFTMPIGWEGDAP